MIDLEKEYQELLRNNAGGAIPDRPVDRLGSQEQATDYPEMDLEREYQESISGTPARPDYTPDYIPGQTLEEQYQATLKGPGGSSGYIPKPDRSWWEVEGNIGAKIAASSKKYTKEAIQGVGILADSEALYYSDEEKAAQKVTREALGEDRYGEIQEKYSPNKGIIKKEAFSIADAEALKYDPKLLENQTFFEKVITTVPQVVGQALISVASGGALSMPAMGAMIIGSSYNQMISEGATHENAERQSILNAIYQMPLEQLGIGGITKHVPGRKKIFQALKNLFMEGLGEGVTEFLQEYPDAWTNIMAKEPDANSLKKLLGVIKDPKVFMQALESGLIGTIIGGGASIAGTGVKKAYNLLTGKEEAPAAPPPPGSDKQPPVGEIEGRADANQILENAAANLETAQAQAQAQAGAIPEPQMAQPEMPLGTPEVATEVTPEVIPQEGGISIEDQAAEQLGAIPEQPTVAKPGGVKVTEGPSPAFDTLLSEYKDLTAEGLMNMPQEEFNKVPVAVRAKLMLEAEGKPATKAEIEQAVKATSELQAKGKKMAAEKKGSGIVKDLMDAAAETEPNPTKAEIEADSYDQGKLSWNGFKIAIETAKGMIRTGIDTVGKKWSQKMNVDYGKIKGVKGADGEDLDIAFRRSDNPKDYDNVYVIDQLDPNTGEFDEHKVYVGYSGAKQAELGYRANYEKGWKGFGGVTVMSKGTFKNFLKRMDTKRPAAGQTQITRKEWLANPEVRPAKYDKAEYRPGATGQVEKIVNATIEKEYETWSEKVAPKKTGPRIEQVTELIRVHRPDLNQGDLRFIDVNDITPGMRDQFRSAIMMAEALGNDTIIIESDIDLNLNGVFLRSLNLIVLNSVNPRPVMTVFMHESTHALQQSNPVLYKELEKYVFRNTKKGAYNRWLKKYKKTNINLLFNLPPKNVLRAEFVAYTVGVASGYESFYKNLAKKDPALFKKVVDYTLESIRLVINRVGAYIAKYSRGEGKIEFKDANQAVKDIANMFDFAASETAANKEIDALVEEWAKEAAIEEEVKQFMAEEMAADVEEYKTVKAPKRKRIAYKLFRTLKSRPGELFPLFIGKSEPVPVGKWLEAQFIPTKGFAQRPGWHSGVMPRADHLLKKDGTMPADRVWAEVEIPDDIGWQEKADAQKTGDIQGEVPKGGYYRFKRPANQGGEWMISGSMKIKKILTAKEVSAINEGDVFADIEAGDFDDWFSGSKVTDEKGQPLVVYHGSPVKDIDEFKGKTYGTVKSPAISFAARREYAESYTGKDGRIYEAYLSIKNPKMMKGSAMVEDHIAAESEGYDGAIISDADGVVIEYVAYDPNLIRLVADDALLNIEVSETDDANTIALNAISGLADGKTTITIDDKKVGARPIIESLGFVRQGKSNNYKFDERVPKDADIIAGMYQAAWHVDLKTKGTTKELFGQVSKRLGRIQREGLGEAEQSEDQKKFRNYLNESWLTYREAADATARGNQLPTKNVLVRPKSVESGRGRQLTVQIASDFRAEEASHIGDPYYEAIYNNREGYARPSRDFWEVPEWMTRLAYFMPKADVYVIRNLEEAIAFFNESNYDQIFFSVLDTNKRFVKHIAENYDGDIIAGGYLPDGSYYKGMKNVSWMANMEEAAKKVGVPFKNGVDYRHFEGTRTIPRLELSRGCLHKCAFCSQERTLKLATPAEIDNQINEFKSFDYDIVYLNDKTFGQAANYEQLIGVKEKIKKANPKFKGFVIQTTAGQYLKMSDQFLKDSGIIYVELGVETFNDKFLKSLHKPHTTALIEKATEKIRRLNQIFVPNVMVGLTGKNKDGTRWVENKDTYANTLDFFKRNRDIISHFNIGVLAAETGTELQKQLDDWQEVDTDEATMNRSWIKNKDVHEKYYYDLSQFGIKQLESKKIADYVAQAIKESQKAKPTQLDRLKSDLGIFWHGSASGNLIGSYRGIHLGTYEAAKQALNATIGVPAEGDWDGNRKYGETLIAGMKRLKELDPRGYNRTGFNAGKGVPEENYYPKGTARHSDGTPISLDSKPVIAPFRVVGKTTNSPLKPHGDIKANALMAVQIKKGTAKSGYYYINEGEDAGSVSIVVPDASFIKQIDVPDIKTKLGVGEPGALFDIDLGELLKKKKVEEGSKGSITGSLLYNDISEIAKAAGGWKKIGSFLENTDNWKGIPVSKNAVRYLGNLGVKLSKDVKLRNEVKSIESFRKRLAAGEVDENSPEYKKAHEKYGSELKLRDVSHQKRFYIGVNTIYGPKQPGDITETVAKEHPIFGQFKTEITRDKKFNLVIDAPILSKDYATRQDEIDAIVQENKEYWGWYEDWNSFIKSFKHIPEAKLVKYIKIMAILSAGSGPQGNMKLFTKAANKLESGQVILPGKISEGKDGISGSDFKKIMAIWNDQDPATTLEERRALYKNKVGTYMHVGLFPHAPGIVIDRHMPRLWGYDITWSPNMKHKGFEVRPEVEMEIVRDIKAAAKRNNISTSSVQAALWYKSRVPDVEASTYQEAAAMSPSEYLPGVMHAALRPESLGVGKHFKTTPLKKGEFILATKRDGSIEYNAYSRDDIGNRIYGHTDKNPYAELVYLYEASTMPEKQLKDKKNVYTVDLDRQRIYDGVDDIMGYWGFAAERLKADPFASLTNIFANLVKATEMFDGFVVNAPIGTGRWVLMFDKAKITGVPEDVVAGISDVVDTLESDFPQTIRGINAIFQGRSDKLYDKFKKLKGKYAEIREEYFKPTVARFKNATGGKHEISGMASLRGPLKAIKALMAEFGIENVQNNVILVHTEEGAERNGNFYRFKIKRDFKNIEEIYDKIASYGLEDYNISVTPVSGSFFIEQFVMDSYPESFVENFSKMINEISDKGFPQNITYRATSEVLGDPNWTGRPAKALKYYRADLIDYFGEKEGNQKYAKAIKAAQVYKKEIGKRGAAGEALFDVDFTEDTGERVRQDYGRPVESQDVEGQFERPGEPMFDIEAAEPGETRADLWYSQLQRTVESKSFPGKSSPKQMISVLEGMARKGQIKQTELDWAGLVDWLDYIKGPVTKAQVLEFLDKNNVKLEEKILGGDMQESEAGRRVIADTMLDGFDPTSPNWGILEDELATWVIKGGDIENYQTIQDLWDDTDSTSAIRTDSGQKIYNWVGRMGLNQWIDYYFSPEDTGVEYGQYTIDEEGSPEYREILISMERQDVVDGALEALDWYENKVPDAFPAMTKGMSEQDQMRYKMSKLGKLSLWQLQKSGAPEYLVKNFKKWQNAVDFKIPHWREKPVSDVVAHLRTDVKEIGGKRTLFIEEIQSDWAQRGRKVGYIDLSKAAPVGYHIVSQLQPDKTYVVKQLYEDSTGKLLAEASMINEALEKAGFNPNAFVKQTPFMLSKSWALLVLKRAVRYAAEHGFDQIAWTGGQIQVERYEEAFRKRVDLIIYNRKTGLIRAFYDKQEVYQKSLKSDDEVSEYIGDANAKSILSGEMYKEGMTSIPKSNINPGYYNLEDGDSVLEGNNIIIDEDGMKGFYDEIVPSTFKRFFSKKKWGSPELKQEDIVVGDFLKVNYIPSHLVPGRGGVKLESAKFQIYENGEWNTYSTTDAVKGYIDSEKLYSTPLHGDIMGFRIKDAMTLWAYEEKVPDGFSTIEEFLKIIVQPALNSHLGAMEEKRPIWVSPITEKMRSSAIEEGFPMFDIEEADIPKESGAVLKDKIGRKEKTLSTKIATSVKEFGENWQTYMLDKLHPIADWFGNDSGAYMTHRGLPGVQSTLNAFMEQGKLKMLDDGSITTEESGKGFLKWLSGLGQDAEKFLYWQIAKRSEVLTGEDRELLLTDSDRQKIYNWVGEKPKSRDSWQEISDEFAEWNQNMLDLAIKSGLLSKEQIDTWQSDFYIPFYRIFEDEQARMEFVRGPAKGRKYISAQVKRLRGSESRMGDPMENIIKNWSALLGNSMFNIARKETFEFANKNNIMSGMTRINEDTGAEEQIPVLEQIPWAQTVIFKQIKGGMTFVQEKTGDPVLAFKDGGKSVFFKVNDPELFNALSGVNKAYFDNVLMKVMSGSKRLLTLGATITPAFRIANMLRDTLHTFQISDNFIPFWDTARGFMKIWKNDPEYAQFMASGHAFGGSYVRAEDPRAMKRYTDRIVKREGKGALKRVLDTAEKLWGFWEDVGEASENAARIQLYSNLKKKGKTHMQAAFAARDLMDFQMSGASNVVQFFIQTIPFLNARMQGLYRMGRAAALDPKSFLIKGSLIATASLALWLLYWDDDRYKELEDWEKFAYYHFWIGGVHFRIPKPFETGVVFSSSVEAAANVMSGNDEISHVFNYLKHAFLETFAFNPVPQVIRPAAEIYMNKSFFTGREIESQSKKRLRPGERYDPWDSETLRLLGEGLNISPKKAEALIRGYTASLGMGILAASDLMVRNIADFPERPSKDIGDYPAIGRFVKGKVSRYTKHMSKFYDLYNEVDELVATVNNYKRIGEFEKARELAKANRKLLSLRSGLGDARKELGDISLEIRKVWFSKKLTSDQKRDRLLVLTERRNNIVRKIYDRYLNK